MIKKLKRRDCSKRLNCKADEEQNRRRTFVAYVEDFATKSNAVDEPFSAVG